MSSEEGQPTSVLRSQAGLPLPRTSFIGRRQELAELTTLIQKARLVTLTGAAGCGKTRLALRLAREVGEQVPDGVQWIELASLTDGALLAQTIAKALNVREQPGRPALETLIGALKGRPLLLVLDNCEHLSAACSRLVEQLLADTSITLLATSRHPLNVAGERLFPIEPLPFPPLGAELAELAQYDAIRLFVERAQAILPEFELTSANANQVATICRSLDCIPLAIELASARVRVLTADQIVSRLDDHFALLPPAPPMTHSHHTTLRAAIDWSHKLLNESERILLRRLAVFAGGARLSSVRAVCSGTGLAQEEILDLLASLVDQSLVQAKTLHRSEARYRLLETVRQYAAEKLQAADEWAQLKGHHLAHFLDQTQKADRKLRGEQQQLWLNWLEREYDNIRAALSWSLESDEIEAGLRICVALYQFWVIRDYVDEGATWLARLLDRADDEVAVSPRVEGLSYATLLAGIRGRTATQITYGREAVATARAASEVTKPALALALAAQGFGARALGDHHTEFALAQEIIQLWRELGDSYQLGLALSLYTPSAMALGEYAKAQEMLSEALPLLRQAGDPYRVAMALNYRGDLARCLDDYHQARSAYEESLAMLRALEAERDLASVKQNLGHTLLHLGHIEQAQPLLGESLETHQVQQNRDGLAESLLGAAALALVTGRPVVGTRLLAAAAKHGGRHITAEWPATRREHDHYLEQARSELTARRFQEEQEAGQRLTLEEATALARRVSRQTAAAGRARRQLDALTPREQEVAALVAKAKSNAEIAADLVISKRTVETHISHIYAKLGFDRRAEIVRWAMDSGLVNPDSAN